MFYDVLNVLGFLVIAYTFCGAMACLMLAIKAFAHVCLGKEIFKFLDLKGNTNELERKKVSKINGLEFKR